ncbi:unnamed protein product, partial [Closterium sp. NIES-64]
NLLVKKPRDEQQRAQVRSKEVPLPDGPPAVLDAKDVQVRGGTCSWPGAAAELSHAFNINEVTYVALLLPSNAATLPTTLALQLSDAFGINEVDCVALLVAAHHEWGIAGRADSDVVRLAAGLWFTERRALLSTLFLLLKVRPSPPRRLLSTSVWFPLLPPPIASARSPWQWWATAQQADRPSTAGPRVLDHVCVLGYFLFLPHSHSTAPSHPPLSLAASNGGRQYRRPATPRPRVCAFLPTWHYLLPFHSPPTSPSRSALSLSIPCRTTCAATCALAAPIRPHRPPLPPASGAHRPDAAGSGSPSLALVVAGAAPPAGASPVAGGGERGGGGGGEGVGEYVMDGRGLLARRADVVQRERLLVAQCVALSCLLCRLDPKEAKELFELLQDAARDWSAAAAAASSPSSTALALPPIPAPFSIPAAPSPAPTAASTATASAATAAVALHITYTLMFALLHALLSDSSPPPPPPLPPLLGEPGAWRGGCAFCCRPCVPFCLFSPACWAAAPSSAAPASPSPSAALPAVLAPNEAFLKESSIMRQPWRQEAREEDVVGDEVAVAREVFKRRDFVKCHDAAAAAGPITRERIRELRHASLSLPFLPPHHLPAVPSHADVDKAARLAGAYPHSMPELMAGGGVLWQFVMYVGEEHRGAASLVAFLNLLAQLVGGGGGGGGWEGGRWGEKNGDWGEWCAVAGCRGVYGG